MCHIGDCCGFIRPLCRQVTGFHSYGVIPKHFRSAVWSFHIHHFAQAGSANSKGPSVLFVVPVYIVHNYPVQVSIVQLKWVESPRANCIIIKYLMSYYLIMINYIFDYDVKFLIVMEKARGLLAHFDWTCGQGKCEFQTPAVLLHLCTASLNEQ